MFLYWVVSEELPDYRAKSTECYLSSLVKLGVGIGSIPAPFYIKCVSRYFRTFYVEVKISRTLVLVKRTSF